MLTCGDCGRTYADDADAPWRCDCGHPLDYDTRPLPEADHPPAHLDRDRGLWAFEPFLDTERAVTLGEGWTPLVDAPEWDTRFKLESIFPTGSFKDRGAALTVSRAAELGVDRVLEDSSGNAGLAIATYAARAGIDAEIYVPADAKPGKLRAIERTGADVVRVEGSRGDVTDACVEAVEGGAGGAGGWYASHAWNPAFFRGTATFAFELAAQRDWTVPDAVVTPLGHGTLFLGAYRGFRALRDAGWTDSIPRLLGAQATGAAPVADALGDDSTADRPANDGADGIQIREPARFGQILDAIEATDGDALAVGPDATEREHDRLARAGFHVEPTCATATAALAEYRDQGVVAPEDDVAVALTGTGLKG
ncbi:pyridoxal-phosphate dependent enzyme [Halosimplex litoreum]|uniref:Pyridoxal-phosphate dependent enzyme n=1 Tax=Halosimplex litoreum TaxID=1198301 RepID=A0A7U3WBE6_9EURY|nr:pyridoxal-phosphate dependent enzyme [Halosimplex litoreum]QPV64941.1 pyridoxal-phosphate dependent enzyme [Halosimplex litoreum]